MATIRALWDSGGELVNRDSPFFPLRNALFDLPPYRGNVARDLDRCARSTHKGAPLAVMGMAYFPGFPHRPVDYKQRLDVVRSAASDAGRDPMSIILAVQLFVVTGRTRDDVDEALDSEILRLFGLGASDEIFARHGAQHPLGAGFAGIQALLPHEIDEQAALSYAADIPSSLVREYLFQRNTLDEVIEQAAHVARLWSPLHGVNQYGLDAAEPA